MKKALTSFVFLFLLGLPGYAQNTDIFLKAIEAEFQFVDIDQDADGNTYVLGRKGSSSSIKKFDSAGLLVDDVVFSAISSPVAFDIASNGYIYVAGTKNIRRVRTSDLVLQSANYNISSAGLGDMSFRDMEYVPQTGFLVAGAQNPGSRWPRFIRINANLSGSGSVTAVTAAGYQDGGGSRVNAMTLDDQGNVYMVGETSTDASSPLSGNRGYIARYNTSGGLTTFPILAYNDIFDIYFNNGWIYVLGVFETLVDDVVVYRFDTSLGNSPKACRFNNPHYSDLRSDGSSKKMKFSLSSDALDNLYVAGYGVGGTTTFYDDDSDEFQSIASTLESGWVAKLDTNFKYDWVKSPMQSPLPTFGSRFKVAWDGKNSRLWWSGSFSGSNGLSMQEGSDSSTRITLPQDGVSQGFVAVFEPDGAFTEIVDFTLLTDYGENRVKLNDTVFGSTGSTFSLILDSQITVQTPRTVYEWDQSGGSVLETDDIEANQNVIDNSDTRFSFMNFSVNSVVEDSNATVYTFNIQDVTTIQLEWLVEYALEVSSNFQDTASLATQPDGSLYIDPLNSPAAGNPSPGVGKSWIEANEPVTLQINGSYVDLQSHPGLNIRYVPYGYVATGAFSSQIAATGVFGTVEPRQELDEFTMSGPTSVTYMWKLQYGVDIKTSNLSAEALMLVEFVNNLDGTTTGQSSSEGAGVHWYDDGTTVRIGAPRELMLSTGPQALEGWLNGDNLIFNPVEDSFDVTNPGNPFTTQQIDNGFQAFSYNSEEYIGLEAVLDHPARVVWNYGDQIIFKTLSIGEFVEFTSSEVFNFGLRVNDEPTLSAPADPSGSGGVATAEDYIWDPVAKKFFPVRNIEMELKWPSDLGDSITVHLTVVWGTINYQHIADSAPVSLVTHPPASQPVDLVFKSMAYTEGDAYVDDDTAFTASLPGLTVLEFNRVTPSGRGGTAQSVVELKVVETNLWKTNLGSTQSAIIGQKVTSSFDKAGLGTGYLFFDKARNNPFIYNRDAFNGEALWDGANPPGPVIPVNLNPTASEANNDEFVVVWYDDPTLNDHFLWPYKAVRYSPRWPANDTEGLGRILMSSGFGSESVNALGDDQIVAGDLTVGGEFFPAVTTFDPARLEQVSVYNQPDPASAGYNPNEEHALIAPSLRFASVAPRPPAIYAMRENDLNVTSFNAFYTSDPYVLVQFLDKADNEFKMKVFEVAREDLVNYQDGFSSEMAAGEPVIPFYPLGVVSGATLCSSSYAQEGDPTRLTFWRDHKDTAWAVSGDGAFRAYFYYPLSPDFVWPDGSKSVGDCVAWLPNPGTDIARDEFTINYDLPDQTPLAQGVDYSTVWPLEVPVLKVGETLTFAGGEYAADNPGATGLPGLLAWAAGEVIYDDLNPDMREGSTDQDSKSFENYTCRIFSALEERTVDLPVAKFPVGLLPATGRTDVDGTIYKFPELSSSLKKRIFYDPLRGKLGIKGFVNDKDIGDNTLTAAPPAVYILEPNVLTESERNELNGSREDSPFRDIAGNGNWTAAVNALFNLSRNPNGLNSTRKNAAGNYTVGLQVGANIGEAESYQALGPGLALFANPGFLDPSDSTLPGISYVTLAENNDPDLGGSPVILHIIKVDRRERYRGAIKVVLSDNVFDENIILRHTGDFGANADDLVFDWWYRVEDGTEALPPDMIPAGVTNPWKLFPDPSGNMGQDFFQLQLKGNPQAPELLLADSLWFVRYRHLNEVPLDPVTWEANPEIPFEWAGAGNSSPNDLDGDGLPDYQAQLAQGWVKRVLDAVNPYEARIRDFNGDNPATYASMIRQFGQRYEGAVALNPDKNVIENVGLIELYSTILDRARSLSIELSTPVTTPGITNALLLASTRLADFYMLLGNEAYTDAQDPMIGFGSNSVQYGDLAPTVFTFQNQLSSQMEEELGLLRGVFDFKARPVYNRLFWNFTKGEGEAAYATAYNISDANQDGFIDEDDAMILYPQGHGDAWGHYLTAIRGQYELLNHPFFNWVSRSELYNLQDIVFEVDFLDERKFAQVAAAKAKAGSEIVQLTYRDSYVNDPESQWQGYLDTDPQRAWGVEGWARRAGQGAYFDWVTANALIPSEHPNSSFTGIRKVDRTTVKDIAVISANMNSVQQTFEDANNGFNPLGVAGNTVPFDIDPGRLGGGGGVTHFEQVYERAVGALNNAIVVFDYANQLDNMLRRIENNEVDFRRSVFEQDLSYRNRLIEIFGTPYDGTIGSGRAYPAGYDGPDTSLYMYVDNQVREITASTVPTYTNDFSAALAGTSIGTFGNRINLLYLGGSNSADLRATFSPSFSSNSPSDWISNFSGVNYIVTDENGIDFDSGSARVGLSNMDLPIKGSGYTFAAPDSWGQRSSPGQLQVHIAKMIQQEAGLAKSIAAWDGFQGDVLRQLLIIDAQLDMDSSQRGLLGGKIANNTILGLASIGLKAGAGVIGIALDTIEDIEKASGETVPEVLPTGGFSISPGDALSAVKGAIFFAGAGAQAGLTTAKFALEQVAELSDLTKSLINEGLDFEIDADSREFSFKQALVELENTVGDEGILRVEVFRQQEALRQLSEEYRSLLQKGARLIDEREAYNKRVAELVQRNRYQDMTFRVGRNAALQRYHEAFDLAARYSYLAAKAYDYETNLHPSDAGSAQGILPDIVAERSLGMMFRGEPTIGKGGLSEQLAKMKANFDVLKGQLGINAPQTETGRFSLRQEMFRISPASTSDTAWSDTLAGARVENLWDLPEFRRYCRPFAPYDPANAEPGLVIEFSSEITSRKNFFGRNLAGGDNAYDPTNFATKVFSVGAWFEGYLSSDISTDLSETPRIYLIPVGSDVMAYPSDISQGLRLWNVLDQKIPVPYPVLETNLDDNAWRPLDTLGGSEAEIRKFSSFRAYHDSGYFDEGEMTFDNRLVGRSVWNTRWLLIIPGSTLNADPDVGLNTFVDNISDIKLFFQTYGYSGN